MRLTSPSWSVLTCVILMGSALSRGDVLHLKDGTLLEGSLKHTDDGWIVFDGEKGKPQHILNDRVQSVELTPGSAQTPKAAMDRLTSLRRSLEGLSDLADITARLERFIDQNTDLASTSEARKDLVIFQDRQKLKMMKVGAHWVDAADREKLMQQAIQNTEIARQLMKQGRTREAEPILTDVMQIDPSNASAQYLAGVLRYQQEQIADARKAFESANGSIPDHAPTLNNLAVVLWRQRQYIAAMSDFDQAMLDSPVDKLILDNAALALETLPAEFQKSRVVAKMQRHFSEQDQQLAEQMSHQGMRRVGSLWISDKDSERMRQQDQQIAQQLDQLASDFDRSRQNIDKLNQALSDNQLQMRRIESSGTVMDPLTGFASHTPYPSAYYDLQRDIQNEQHQHDVEVAKLDQFKKQASDLQSSRATQKAIGAMRIFGVDGSPKQMAPAVHLPPDNAAIAPATRPGIADH